MNEDGAPPQQTRVCVRAGKSDWIGIIYADAPTKIDPSTIHEYVPASAIEDFRRRAIEAVRALTEWEYDSAAGGEFNRFTKNAVIKVIQSLPATENNTNE